MMSSPEDYSASSDARAAPGADACEAAGFYLIDDCEGRFVIDHAFGVISLVQEDVLAREPGAEHRARIRVVEPSGESYELSLRLRLTGRIPQMVGEEENDFIAGIAGQAAPSPAPELEPNWLHYAVSHGALGKQRLTHESAPFGAMFEVEALLPAVGLEQSRLELEARLPQPSRADAAWVL
ncbi:MAG: hypothetical protein NW206_02965 [Hyphomonadaceae bacterium]|nr:hypothetical protein [Hyphomonadaceae bacterium]